MEPLSISPTLGERWKVIELNCDALHEIAIVRIVDRSVFWGLSTFHHHLRQLKVGRRLGKLNGYVIIGKIYALLCPALDCRWNASSRMKQQQKRHFHGEAAEDTGTNGTATIPWLLVYLLHVNVVRACHKGTKHLRNKSFRLFASLAKFACNVEGASKLNF